MNEVIDSPMVGNVSREVAFSHVTSMPNARSGLPRGLSIGDRSVSAPRLWNSTLSGRDLTCLLQIIEGDLIPQLVHGYSPARQAPLEPVGSSG